MHEKVRSGPHKYYKGKYFIVFYDREGEQLLYMFNNVREILEFRKLDITRQNVNLMNVELYRALRQQNNDTQMLNGRAMKVYIIDVDDDETEYSED